MNNYEAAGALNRFRGATSSNVSVHSICERKTFTLLERLEGLDHLIGRKKTANDFVRKMSLVLLMYKIQISSKSLREIGTGQIS